MARPRKHGVLRTPSGAISRSAASTASAFGSSAGASRDARHAREANIKDLEERLMRTLRSIAALESEVPKRQDIIDHMTKLEAQLTKELDRAKKVHAGGRH